MSLAPNFFVLRWIGAVFHTSDSVGNHPVTTSFARHEGNPDVHRLAQMDLQVHDYSENGYAGASISFANKMSTTYQKSIWMGEFGQSGPDIQFSTIGIEIVNGQLGPVFALGGGGSMLRWWDSYVDPHVYDRWGQVSGWLEAAAVTVSKRVTWEILDFPIPKKQTTDRNLAISGICGDNSSTLVWFQNIQWQWKPTLQRGGTPPLLQMSLWS